MRVQLLHLNGPYRGRTITYTERELLFGTDPTAHVRYAEDRRVVPRHARVVLDPESCKFHLQAIDGDVFVNHRQARDVVLEHGDLLEIGRGGPLLRFREEADKGRTCKPVGQMLHDAKEVGTQSGVWASATTLRRDIVKHSSTRLRVYVPLALLILVFGVSYLGGWLGGRYTARQERVVYDQRAEVYEDELSRVRGEMDEFHRRQAGRASREEVDALKRELARYTPVVDDLSRRSAALKQVLDVYSGGVCLLHGVFTFKALKKGEVVDVRGPDGEVVELEYVGSGFLATPQGHIITNRHVAEPWWNNKIIEPLLERGLKPHFQSLDVYFPGRDPIAADPSTIVTGSDKTDVAVLQVPVEDIPVLPLHEGELPQLRGERVVLLGYPTGVNAILARSDPEVAAEVLERAKSTRSLIGELARRRAISPVITQGALNDVRDGRLVYDAETTSGGSGGPVFGPDGTVIGVNFAITKDFDGSNFGLPIEYARKLLP